MEFIREILRLCVAMLFSAFAVNMAFAVQMTTFEFTYFQTETAHPPQAGDVGFAVRSQPLAAGNVTITGGATVMQGGAFAVHEQETVAALFGFGIDLNAPNRGVCSFHADTLVLTDGGLLPISNVNTNMSVWSRNPANGDMDWQRVQAQYSNPYDETVSVTMRDVDTGAEQTIVSNRIHPYFMQTARAVVNSSDGHFYTGPLENGHWVDAAELQAGDRLLNDDGTWAEVVGVKVEAEPLTAFNLTVAEFHTYFVAGNENAEPVWVHNNCFDNLSGSLGTMGRAEFDRLATRWGSGSFDNLSDSLRYHADRHWGVDIAGYLRASSNFTTRGASSSGLRADGTILYTKNGQFAVFRDGNMVTFGRN